MEASLSGDACDRANRLRDEARLLVVAESWPVENLQCSAGIFGKGGAAFNPVAVVEVDDSLDPLDGCVMNMTAHDAVEAARARLPCHSILEAADVLDRIFHLLLQVRGKRPVGQTKCAPDHPEDFVQVKRQGVSPVPQMREPLRAGDHSIELIAMDDEQPLAVRGLMDSLALDLDAGDVSAAIFAERLVVI